MATSARAGITYPDQSDTANMQASMLEMITSAEGYVVSKHATTTARGTAIPSPTNGDICFVTDTAAGATNNAFNVRQSAAWVAMYTAPLFAYKTAQESVTSSTVTQADNHLFVTVEANRIYTLEMWLNYTGVDAGDLKLNFSYPANCSVAYGNIGYSSTATGAAPVIIAGAWGTDASTPTSDLPFGTITGSTVSGIVNGLVIVGNTGGALTLNWAQNTSSGTATSLETGCWMRLMRVG